MPYTAKTHEENRKTLCVVCIRKAKGLQNITENIANMVKKHAIANYTSSDISFPTSICGTCRLTLSEYDKGNFSRKLEVFDHSKIKFPISKDNTNCQCKLCTIARQNLHSIQIGIPRKEKGRPPKTSKEDVPSSHSDDKEVLKVCSRCLSTLKQGKNHECNKLKRGKNVLDLAEKSSPNCSSKISSSFLKKRQLDFSQPGPSTQQCSDQPSEPSDNNPYSKGEKRLFTVEDLRNIQTDLSLSQRKTLKLSKSIRESTGSKVSIESNLKTKLNLQDHMYDEYYSCEELIFIETEKSVEKIRYNRYVVYCNDVEGLIQAIIKHRSLLENNILIKIGIDGGGGFLKICLNLFTMDECSKSKTTDHFKNSGVKKLIILAIVPQIQENYENIKKIWIKTGLQNLKRNYIIASDLKLCNMLLGLTSHSSLHPCCWCNINKANLNQKGEERTFKNLNESFWRYFEDGVKRKGDYKNNRSRAKFYGNVAHSSILPFDTDIPVLYKVPPPELHLLTGPLNTLYNGLLSLWPEASNWLKRCNVERDAIHGGSFTGNSARLLLKKVDVLAEMCPPTCKHFVNAFKSFSKVVESCYGKDLDPSFNEYINDFEVNYSKLALNFTPKVHAVIFHIPEFCLYTKRSLGFYSEQASESVHYDFSLIWANYKVNSLTHPDYHKRLLNAVCVYNSRHF